MTDSEATPINHRILPPSSAFLGKSPDGDPSGAVTLPDVGPVFIWHIPGFEIVGMDEQRSLAIEVLAPPAKDTIPLDEWVLWHWSPQTELAVLSTSPLYLLGTGMRTALLDPATNEPPPPFMLADPVAGQQGFHNHGLLAYGLDNDPPPAAGAYGFFARLISNFYEPSEPFLVVFNRNVDYAQMIPAALAINAAAGASNVLPGDYNRDGAVDAADYIIWRRTLGSTTELAADGSGNEVIDEADYGVWRSNFGTTASSAGGVTMAVPEPAGLVSALIAMLGAPLAGAGVRAGRAKPRATR